MKKNSLIYVGLIGSLIFSSMNLLTVNAIGRVIGTDLNGNPIIGGIYDELVGFDENGGPIIKNTNPNPDKPVPAIGRVIGTDLYGEPVVGGINDVLVGFDENEDPIISTLGDINFDGKTDITDLSELSLALVGDKELTEAQQKAADVDGDGTVKLADLAKFRQFLSKQISSLG